MAKCLYGGLFDWIVLQINHALLAKRDYKEHQVYEHPLIDHIHVPNSVEILKWCLQNYRNI